MRRRIPFYILALFAGCSLSSATFVVIRHWEYRSVQHRLEKVAEDRAELLRSQVLTSMEVLHSIASLYASRGTVTREEFREFVRGARDRQPEIQALEWVPRISGETRANFESDIQAEAHP